MKYSVDIHTHTVTSGHAYNTIMENARQASSIGLTLLGTSDHGPAMPGAPHHWHFGNMRVLPRELFGVTMLYGCEANIIDYDGKLDLPLEIQKRIDYMIVSFHEPLMKSRQHADLNTAALLKAMDNPNVSVIGHSGNPEFPIHMEAFVAKAKEKNILVEINNSSFERARKGSEPNCKKIAALCRDYGVRMILSSDAHWCEHIGEFSAAEKILKELDIPDKLIVNTDKSLLLDFLRQKGKSL